MASSGGGYQNQSSNANSFNYGVGTRNYSTTTTSNPYVSSTTSNSGTSTSFAPNSALSYVNNYMNQNIGNLINDYLNPNINSSTNQALIENYRNNLSKEAGQLLNNDIITPLANRNMIRSSQATNLYSNLSNNLNNKISDYTASLLSNAQNQANDKLATLYNMYMNGYNVVNGNQAQSLGTSQGNGTTINLGIGNQSSNTTGSSFNNKVGI